MSKNRVKWLLMLTALISAVYAALLVPETPPVVDTPSTHSAFVWGQNEYWSALEAEFRQKRNVRCTLLANTILSRMHGLDSLLHEIGFLRAAPSDPALDDLEKAFFEMGVLTAVCPELLQKYVLAFEKMRYLIKDLSFEWNLDSREASDRLYRLLYGGRTAVEEAMLQAEPGAIPELERVCHEPSRTPVAEINGVEVHSGDILISRGGAPTSALIARGSDYAGNFSHAALLHVDEFTAEISIIEAHIECGVTVSTREQYLSDKKLRIMVLRPRSDLPSMIIDPLLPHRAACLALDMATSNHIPYDFEMNTKDHTKLFCSEVVSSAYDSLGLPLWRKLSHISEPGLRRWLAAFGVRNFTTQEPSDLEYDPQLRVVAEWRDSQTLMEDHIDNAIIDVMLEGARNGDRLEHSWYMLPLARITKLYSVILNCLGEIGPIPEGMGATSALQNQWLSERHRRTKTILKEKISEFKIANGYIPPYWELVRLAREAYKGRNHSSSRSNSRKSLVGTTYETGQDMFYSDSRWRGGDCASSVDLGDGRVLWLFADSYISVAPPYIRDTCCVTMIRNCLGVQTGNDPSEADFKVYWRGTEENPSAYFPCDDTSWYWPGNAVKIDSFLLVFLMHLCPSDSGLGFRECEDYPHAAFLVNHIDRDPLEWAITRLVLPRSRFGIMLGAATLIDQPFLYMFNVDLQNPSDRSVFLSRWHADSVLTGSIGCIEWWTRDDSSWVPDPYLKSRPTTVFTEGATELSIVHDESTDSYLAIQTIGFGAADVMMRTSPALTGPWSEPQLIYEPPEKSDPEIIIYAGKAHAWVAGADLAITYNTNAPLEKIIADTTLYYPRFIRLNWRH